jgi:hypothetical protein
MMEEYGFGRLRGSDDVDDTSALLAPPSRDLVESAEENSTIVAQVGACRTDAERFDACYVSTNPIVGDVVQKIRRLVVELSRPLWGQAPDGETKPGFVCGDGIRECAARVWVEVGDDRLDVRTPQAGIERLSDLRVLNDVGPVLEDPVAPAPLMLHHVGQSFSGVVEQCRLSTSESFNEVLVVARGGVEDRIEFSASGDELTMRTAVRPHWGLVVTAVKPGPRREEPLTELDRDARRFC